MNAFILFLHNSHPTIFFSQSKTNKKRENSILPVNHKNAGKMRMNFIRLGKTQKTCYQGINHKHTNNAIASLGSLE